MTDWQEWAAQFGADLHEDATADSAASAVVGLSSVVEELKGRVDQAATLVKQAMEANSLELQMGRVFVRAQGYIDNAVADAKRDADEIIADARKSASRIIAEARQQAQAMIEEARNSPPFPVEVIQNLDRTIQSFQRANVNLNQELSQLNAFLRAKLPANDNGHEPVTAGSEVTPQVGRA